MRDGRDTLESFSKSWGGDGAFKKMCIRWSNRVDAVYEFQKQADAAGLQNQYHFVRFDALNDNTEQELRMVIDFIGLDQDKYPWDQLEHIPILGSSAHKVGDRVHWDPIKKTSNFNPNQKWLEWSPRKKRIFKKYAGANLIKAGFASNLNW